MTRRFNNNRPSNFRAPWTREDENRLFADAEKGVPLSEVAGNLGRSERAVKMKLMNNAKRELARYSKDEIVEKYNLDNTEFTAFLENDGKLPPDTTNVRPNFAEQLEAINAKLNVIMTHFGLSLETKRETPVQEQPAVVRYKPNPPTETVPEEKPKTKSVKSAQKTKKSEANPDDEITATIVKTVIDDLYEGKVPSAKLWKKRDASDEYHDIVHEIMIETFATNPKSRSPCDNEFCEQKGTRSLTYKGKRYVFCDDCLNEGPGETAMDDLRTDVENRINSMVKV